MLCLVSFGFYHLLLILVGGVMALAAFGAGQVFLLSVFGTTAVIFLRFRLVLVHLKIAFPVIGAGFLVCVAHGWLGSLLYRLDFKLGGFGAQGRSLCSRKSVKLLSVGAHGVFVTFGGSSKEE
ncbi:MAG: hypothetical protein BYD32DRAFT_421970 [Podila humilis]|nr:MAG: hypothetical protein BYD32DRAFT_421970 [Podila humilis]